MKRSQHMMTFISTWLLCPLWCRLALALHDDGLNIRFGLDVADVVRCLDCREFALEGSNLVQPKVAPWLKLNIKPPIWV